MTKYDHIKIEKKWQQIWEETQIYKTNENSPKEKFYSLVMFPYPSGDLHIGHWYNFSGSDFYSRYKRMQGYNVLQPIGFDSFGLPAENAAIKRGIAPKTWTYDNISNMTRQLKRMGAGFDWDKMVKTSDPDYYRWTQWMFLELYNRGLAYKKKQVANWCTSCNTVLANEQVVDGVCERCGSEVVQKELDQWLFKITNYADELISGLDNIDWPERTKTMQRNWIGRSEGAMVKFSVESSPEIIEVFTTRADTLYGATFIVLAPEHLLTLSLVTNDYKNLVESYIISTQKKTELERQQQKQKSGVFTGSYALNPINGEKIPIWISDYVLSGYGTGAIMAVPAHDERDYEFSQKFHLPVIKVINSVSSCDDGLLSSGDDFFSGQGVLVNSDEFNGMDSATAREKIIDELSKKGLAEKKINYKLRDWLISRQRYWGSPIPIVYCDECGETALPVADLPVILPEEVSIKPTGESPLKYDKTFYETVCPKCGGHAVRETDTMDTFVCSSWYYLRYVDAKNNQEFASKNKLSKWMSVDMYIGGAEHSVLHLLYSRFFTKALHDGGYLDFDEPFTRLRHQGMILGPDGLKMSKSKGNVIDPDVEVDKYGADAVRIYLAFMGPYDQGGPWNPNGLKGVRNFLDDIYKYFLLFKNNSQFSNWLKGSLHPTTNIEITRSLNKLIKKVSEDINSMKFNTAISEMMSFKNLLYQSLKNKVNEPQYISADDFKKFLLVLAPFAPYLTEELWQEMGENESVHLQSWPSYDESLLQDQLIYVVVQVNGKVRDTILVSPEAEEKTVFDLAITSEKVSKYLINRKIQKSIFIKGKILSIVTD